MPVLIRLETETGVAVADTSDIHNVLTRRVDEGHGTQFAILHMVDPWGTTALNRLQVPLLLDDLEKLKEGATIEDRATIQEVASLAERVLAEPHLHLKFYGD